MVSTCEASAVALRELTHPLYGITVDSMQPLEEIVDSVASLSKRPTVRVVFGKRTPASGYTEALNALSPISFIMGEILDSYYVIEYSMQQYKDRVKEYLDAHGDKVDLWEIGNEANGKWLGDPNTVIWMVEDAYLQVKSRGYRTALTLHYDENCWVSSGGIFDWAETQLSATLREGLDYLLVSYYEEDCNYLKPDWESVFNRLGQIFPNAYLGFGEIGTAQEDRKQSYIEEYYTLQINHPRYIGGYFWWYFRQDMVSRSKPLWSALNEIWLRQ
jgi:hypothetical protein